MNQIETLNVNCVCWRHLPRIQSKKGISKKYLVKTKSNGEQSDVRELEQVTLKPQLQVHHCLNIWLQIWYYSLIWGDLDFFSHSCIFQLFLQGRIF